MKLLPILFFGLSLCASAATPTAAPDALPKQASKTETLPAAPFHSAGGFVVAFKDALVAGADNGGGFVLWTGSTDGKGQWQPTQTAVPSRAATAKWGDTQWILAGGERDGAPVATVSVLELADGKPVLHPLPDLPKAITGASAAVVGNKLYVLGGSTSAQGVSPVADFWVLDLKAPTAWQPGPKFPGAPRAFASATEQYDMLCVFGGLGPEPLNETWVYRPKPLEGTASSGWKRMADVPLASGHGAALPIGQSQVLVFSEAADGVRPFLFHTLTDTWCQVGALRGLASAVVAKSGDVCVVLAEESGRPAAAAFQINRSIRALNWIDYVVIVLYFAFISLIGILASRHQKSSADFSLAGRNVPWWVAGISMFATGASAISFMAIPALAFQTNLVFLFPIFVMFAAYFVQSRVTYPLLRRMEITSTYEYLERRFNKTLRLVASAQCILIQTFGRASVVLVLPSLAISAVTGISVYVSVILMWAITTVYTAAGGFHAVVWTDVFQGTLKFFAPLAMIGLCIFSLPGGFHEFWRVGVDYQKFDFALMTWDVTVPAVWVLILSTFLAATIGQAGDQPVIQRVFSSPTHEVRRVAMMSTACGILIAIVVNVLGIAIFAYFRAHPGQLDPFAQNDKIVPLFVIQALPHGFIGVVIAAIFASAMTTVASSMNSSATVFTEDFFPFINPNPSDKLKVLVLRIASTVVGLIGLSIALLLATMNLKSIMVTWSIITALLGGGIVGVYSLGMFTTRVNGFGAVSGAIASIIITLLVKLYTPLHWATLLPIAIFTCMACGYLFSFVGPQRKDLTGLTVFTPKPGA